MAITFLAAPVATINRIRYGGVIEGSFPAQGDLTKAAIMAALPNGPLKTALAAVTDAEWNGGNVLLDLRFEVSMYFVKGLGNAATVPVTIDTLVVGGVQLFRFYAPAGGADTLVIFQVAFNHSLIR